MNELLFFVSIIVIFGIEVLVERIFKKDGLYCWVAIFSIIANIEVTKNISLFGFSDWVTLGNVSFASIFLATDILSVKYGYKESKKAVNIGIFSALLFILVIQLDLLFIPSESGEFIHLSMKNLFGTDSVFIWVTVASVLMFYLSNLADVWLFDKLRKKTKGRHLWFANNIATITCNCLENFVFVILGYYVLQLIFIGKTIYTISQCLAIAGTTCMFEIIISLLDTPFLYLAKHKFKKNKDASEKGE